MSEQIHLSMDEYSTLVELFLKQRLDADQVDEGLRLLSRTRWFFEQEEFSKLEAQLVAKAA